MTEHKIRSLEHALRWRRGIAGTVVFTNGVFDLVHPGHVHVLEQARTLGAALVVGLNDDASAGRLNKGYDRPVVPVSDRARVLAAIGAVDCVVIFSQDTPRQLIDTLAPDVLVKGSDYQIDEIPGGELVAARGGRVATIEVVPGYSTTSLIERIRATA